MSSGISKLTAKSRHSRLNCPPPLPTLPIQRSSSLSRINCLQHRPAVRALHTSFLTLPNELLLEIAKSFDTASDLYALKRVNKRFAVLLDHLLSDFLLHAYQKSALLFSSATHYPESLVSHLIRLGVDLNTIDCDCVATDDHSCMPALHRAVSLSNEPMVRSLLRHGARINVPYNCSGDNAVHLAVHTTDLNSGCVGGPRGPRGPDLAILSMLLGSGGLQTMNDPASLNSIGLSWLNMAVRCCPRRNMTIVEPFLSAGVSVDVADTEDNLTPLHVAVCRNNVDLVAVLLNLGADHRTIDSRGRTPFWTACHRPNCTLVDLLLCHDATLIDEMVGERGETAEGHLQRKMERLMARNLYESAHYRGEIATIRKTLAKLRMLADARRNSFMPDTLL